MFIVRIIAYYLRTELLFEQNIFYRCLSRAEGNSFSNEMNVVIL